MNHHSAICYEKAMPESESPKETKSVVRKVQVCFATVLVDMIAVILQTNGNFK